MTLTNNETQVKRKEKQMSLADTEKRNRLAAELARVAKDVTTLEATVNRSVQGIFTSLVALETAMANDENYGEVEAGEITAIKAAMVAKTAETAAAVNALVNPE